MTDGSLQDALDEMWLTLRPGALARADAVAAALDPDAGEDAREAGRAAAHKLAGLLGTCGRPRGTELARALEHALERGLPDEAGRDALRDTARALRGEVER